MKKIRSFLNKIYFWGSCVCGFVILGVVCELEDFHRKRYYKKLKKKEDK